MGKKFWIATVVAWVAAFFGNWVVHGMVLMGMHDVSAMLRESMVWWGLIFGELLFALALVWIYDKGRETGKEPLGQGARYGIAIGVLHAASPAFITYGLQPVSMTYALAWTVLGVALYAIIGILVALVYGRGGGAPAPAPAM